MTILICGAGIAGLTMAQVCQHIGLDYTVFEAAPNLRLEGAGIQLSPNAMQVLDRLELAPTILAAGHQPDFGEVRLGRKERALLKFPLKAVAQARFGAPYVQIARGKLIEILANGININFKAKIDNITQTKTGVSLHSDFRTAHGQYCIAADGIHSNLRPHVTPPQPASFTGYKAWRAQISGVQIGEFSDTIRQNAIVRISKDKHVVTYPMDGQSLNFVGIEKTRKQTNENWLAKGNKVNAQKLFAEFGREIATLITLAPEVNIWGIFDRSSLSSFQKNQLTLIGDAAHPILPFLAQGGAMAIEDAWALGQCLKAENPKAYSTIRADRTRRIAAAARTQANIYHLDNMLKQSIITMGMGLTQKLMPDASLKRLSWVYSYDILAETQRILAQA